MSSTQSVVELVSSEVVRKLRLAGEADTAEDREIVAEEVFLDVSGILDEAARVQLGAPRGCPFYLVLAHYYASPRGADSAVAVMHLLQKVYGQGYAAPLVALLLHRWLLLRRSPGRGLPEEQRVRLANVMAMGAVQLFVGDIQSGKTLFRPMWHTLCHEVVLGELHVSPVMFKGLQQPNDRHFAQQRKQQQRQQREQPPDLKSRSDTLQSHCLTDLPHPHPSDSAHEHTSPESSPPRQQVDPSSSAAEPRHSLDSSGVQGKQQQQQQEGPQLPPIILGQAAPGFAALPPAARNTLVAAAAAPLPYYASGPEEVKDVLQRLPPPYVPLHPAPEPSTPPDLLPQPSFIPGAGADFALTEITDTLSRIRSKAGLLRYLTALRSLKGDPVLMLVWPTTRLRLQSELYALTSPGGPHYPPHSVRKTALGVLDHLFPANQTTRNVMRLIFKALHPTDWLGGGTTGACEMDQLAVGQDPDGLFLVPLLSSGVQKDGLPVVWKRHQQEEHHCPFPLTDATRAQRQAHTAAAAAQQQQQQQQHDGSSRPMSPLQQGHHQQHGGAGGSDSAQGGPLWAGSQAQECSCNSSSDIHGGNAQGLTDGDATHHLSGVHTQESRASLSRPSQAAQRHAQSQPQGSVGVHPGAAHDAHSGLGGGGGTGRLRRTSKSMSDLVGQWLKQE
eukprot:CAMPEP_0202422266 /NCGR_PEP_ID=MMETSP1128-20130828/50767_1 /ASSEMBLY_ACC=CAM_ASM_000463 /TAXON_ID=3047 /ORGANISM="Dunaliella tertiolecta, Strain CCMP1320" /LENGTH=671 /DNA_ID=CAMNT_0049030321 /DNA_START=160 /DNA_END=2175 /DNA_ORIENTATION=+